MQRNSTHDESRRPVIFLPNILMRGARCLLAMLVAAAPGCSDSQGPGSSEPPPSTLRADPIVTGLASPVFLTAPTGDARLFILEQAGRIRLVKGGNLVAAPFLDITSKVASGGERGLLGLAFHPQYATNGFFFVYYTDLNGDIQVERYKVSSGSPDVADAASATPVITVAHRSASNHNGGMLLFGEDGMLYMGTGDGGGGGDPSGNAQNKSQLLGKLLRLNVSSLPYTIPSNNPFVGQSGARGEIWAYGLRNPWRYAFDRVDHKLYIADVGQGAWEEVDVVDPARGGVNYGWNQTEGNHCYTSGCNTALYEPAILEYDHSEGCSITGGFVYRGQAMPGLRGAYFYSDYCSGWVRSFRFSNGAATAKQTWSLGSLGNILSYGEDAAGELYILSSNGTVYKIVSGS